MRLEKLELTGFKSFAKKATFLFTTPITGIVGPNGSGKSNTVEAVRWVLGERSLKSLRGKKGEDLIWSGSAGRSNRAAVSLTFDNRDRKFPLDYDEVVIGREVYRDGANNYLINGSTVRFRDVVELLSAVSLGASAHSIISQGEADRILTASDRERRLMLEEALGLRLYQWKIEDSEKKLEKTEENLTRVESLRREIAPHLRYLKKQIDKIEKAESLRQELLALYPAYLQFEEKYLTTEKNHLASERHQLTETLREVERALHELEGKKAVSQNHEQEAALTSLGEQLRRLAGRKDELSRRLGRLEGMIEAVLQVPVATQRQFNNDEVLRLTEQLKSELATAVNLEDLGALKQVVVKLRSLIDNFLSSGQGQVSVPDTNKLHQLQTEQAAVEGELAELIKLQSETEAKQQELRAAVAGQLAAQQAAESGRLELVARKNQLALQLDNLTATTERLVIEEGNFKRELAEGVALVGEMVKDYQHYPVEATADASRAAQAERQRQIERLKIKLEDFGGEVGDTLKEYKEVSERDQFLEKELVDLKSSATALRQLIKELQIKVDHDFRAGLEKVSGFFNTFIVTMFGGGSASLSLIKTKVSEGEMPAGLAGEELPTALTAEATTVEEVVEIKLTLPRKKVRDLSILSGGERALVSIALLFAMSQVNPPPFLILDETDAALDEANSRKYSDMLETLSKHCQLVLVTHNRETMSRAGVIYGVTMGSDGVSQLLSIKFDDAVSFAK
jgi:chromosome segregation protein